MANKSTSNAAFRVILQHAQALHYWYVTHRHNSRDRRKTLGHSVQHDEDRGLGKIQSRRIRVSKYKIEVLHAIWDYRSIYDNFSLKCTNLYLSEDYRRKSIGAFYKYELHRAIHTCILWKKYCSGRETTCTLSGWDMMDHTILGYTKTI